jgi:hypothetical protein
MSLSAVFFKGHFPGPAVRRTRRLVLHLHQRQPKCYMWWGRVELVARCRSPNVTLRMGVIGVLSRAVVVYAIRGLGLFGGRMLTTVSWLRSDLLCDHQNSHPGPILGSSACRNI